MWSKLLLYLRRFGLKIFELIERKPSLHKSSYEWLNERLKKVTILESLNYKRIRRSLKSRSKSREFYIVANWSIEMWQFEWVLERFIATNQLSSKIKGRNSILRLKLFRTFSPANEVWISFMNSNLRMNCKLQTTIELTAKMRPTEFWSLDKQDGWKAENSNGTFYGTARWFIRLRLQFV